MRKLLALLASVFIAAGISSVAYADEGAGADAASGGMLAAQSSLATQSITAEAYTLGQEWQGAFNGPRWFTFTLKERSHVYVVTTSGSTDTFPSIYDLKENVISPEANNIHSANSRNTFWTTKHSCNLDAGTYYLRVGGYYENTSCIFKLIMTAEPVASLGRTSITALTSPTGGRIQAKVASVLDALGYQYQYSKKESFAGAKTVSSPSTTCAMAGLAKGTYYYVRVRPYTTYNDGLKVYGDWSRARAVYVKKLSNSVTISTGSKTFQYANLRKAGQSFFVFADDQRNVKLTYAIASAPAKVKSYFSINRSSGKFAVKKGLKRGTYAVKLKVSAAATKSYAAASKTKQITLKVV